MRRIEGGNETKAAGVRWGARRADGLHVTAATKPVSALSETPADGVAAVRSVNAPSLQQLSDAAVRIEDPPPAQHACSLAAVWPVWWLVAGKQGQTAVKLTTTATRAATESSLRAMLTVSSQCRTRAGAIRHVRDRCCTALAQGVRHLPRHSRKFLAIPRPALTGPHTVDYSENRHEVRDGPRRRHPPRVRLGERRRRPVRLRRNDRCGRFERRPLRPSRVGSAGEGRSLFLRLHRSPGRGGRHAERRDRLGSLDLGPSGGPRPRPRLVPAGPSDPAAAHRPLPTAVRAVDPQDLSLGKARAASAAPGF